MISGKEFKALREAKNLTLKDVSKVLGVSEQAINKYELEIVRNIPLEKIELMARLYGVTPSYIMEWDEASSSAAVPVPAADPNEDQLIAMYRELNSSGQKKLREYAEDLLDNDKYKKDSIKNAVVG